MNIFNIHIEHEQKTLTLTVTEENNFFKLICNGGFIGAVKQMGHDWEWVTEEELEVKDLPPLSAKKGLDNDYVALSTLDINRITAEIENYKSHG